MKSKSLEEIAEIAIQKLQLFKNNVQPEIVRSPIIDKPWDYVATPNQRNTFLRTNNYLDKNDSSFGKNVWTGKLSRWDNYENTDHFVTLVTTPNSDHFMDIEEMLQLIPLDDESLIIRSSTPSDHWEYFKLSSLYHKQINQSEIIRYKNLNNTSDTKPLAFFRMDEFSTIEFADSNNTVFHPDGHIAYKDLYKDVKSVFNLVSIIGLFIKFTNAISYIYTAVGYHGKVSLTVNIVNTQKSLLSGFARGENGQEIWRSPTGSGRLYFQNNNVGKTSSKNIQICYLIDINKFLNNRPLIMEMANHLSIKLQRSYNYSPEPRHLLQKSDEFPWKQYQNSDPY